LFKEGWKALDIAIELDLGTDSVLIIQKNFYQLIGLDEFNQAYEHVNGNIASFLHLFDLMSGLGMNPEQVEQQAGYGINLPYLGRHPLSAQK
jgi:hypothetical protein